MNMGRGRTPDTKTPTALQQEPARRSYEARDGLGTSSKKQTFAPESSLCTLPGKWLSRKALPANKMD